MAVPKFAFIYWTEEDCTSVEPTIAFIGVTADNVDDRQEVRDVEWRAGKAKAPEGGFPVFKGQILKASDQKEELQLLGNEVANAVHSEEDAMPSKRVRVQSKKLLEAKENFASNKENIGALQPKIDKANKKRERDEKKKAKQAQIESAQKAAKELLQLVSNWGTRTTECTPEKQLSPAACRTSIPGTIPQHQNVQKKLIKPLAFQSYQNPGELEDRSQDNERTHQAQHKPLALLQLTNEPEDSGRNAQSLHLNLRNPATRKQLCTDVPPQVELECMSQRTLENDGYFSVSEVLCESHDILYTPAKRMDQAKDSIENFQQEIAHLSCQLEKEKENQSNSVYQIKCLQEHIKSLQEKNIVTQNEEIVLLSSKVKQLESGKEKQGDHSPLISLVRQFISDAEGHIHSMSQPEAPSIPEQTIHTARDSTQSTNDATSATRRHSMLITNESSATVELSSGSAVLIDQVKLEMIRRKSNENPSKLTRLLMEQFFSDAQMVGSSALGLKFKKGLDVRHLSAIKDYVYQKHPKIKESEFNLFVNRKCADVRKTMRKAAPKES